MAEARIHLVDIASAPRNAVAANLVHQADEERQLAVGAAPNRAARTRLLMSAISGCASAVAVLLDDAERHVGDNRGDAALDLGASGLSVRAARAPLEHLCECQTAMAALHTAEHGDASALAFLTASAERVEKPGGLQFRWARGTGPQISLTPQNRLHSLTEPHDLAVAADLHLVSLRAQSILSGQHAHTRLICGAIEDAIDKWTVSAAVLLAKAERHIATHRYSQAALFVSAAEDALYAARRHLPQFEAQAVDRLAFDRLHARWTVQWASFVRAF